MKSDDRRYFEWLVTQVDNGDAANYGHLLNDLFDREYTWVRSMDENRAAEGLYLRKEFDADYEREIGCSVLEMLVALCVQFEHNIMGEPGNEDPSRWFWLILKQLDLDIFTDRNYDSDAVNLILDEFLSGQKFIYLGKPGARDDLWYQIGYLSESIFG